MLTDWTELPSMKLGDFTLEFELGAPSAELQEVARKELRETPEVQKAAVESLRELLKGMPCNDINVLFRKKTSKRERERVLSTRTV